MIKLLDLSRLLDAHELEFKVQSLQLYNNTAYAIVVPYKNARTDMQILDEVVGPANWQTEYKRDSQGVLQCGIGIFIEGRGDWVWKWSNGTESQFEKKKGEYSDAFKRAGVMWGIGRCLYSFPPVKVILNEKEYKAEPNEGAKATGFLKPNNWDWDIWIDYDNGEYEQIVVSDSKGHVRFNMNPHKQKFQDPTNKQNITV